jgi:hypothetical protein
LQELTVEKEAWEERLSLQDLAMAMEISERLAHGNVQNLSASKDWLESILAVDAKLVAQGVPHDVRAFTISEVRRAALTHMPWNSLLGDGHLLQKVATVLVEHMTSNAVMRDCCLSDACVYDQVTLLMILEELAQVEVASSLLHAFRKAWKGSSSVRGEDTMTDGAGVGIRRGAGDCHGMVWHLDRLAAPLDQHYPLDYADLVDVASSPAFWDPLELPLARHLEHHSKEIVAELMPLCGQEELSLGSSAVHFGPEKVVQGLAYGSWTSLPLFDGGAWNASACDTVAPLTCSLLRDRPELQGAMLSAANPETAVQLTFVSVYRLRPESHIRRHVGSQWRLNTHLGLVTPQRAHIRVWNESRNWQVGRAIAFLDAAEHEVIHGGDGDRCVLNVVSWHPNVMQQRHRDPVFAAHFTNIGELDPAAAK